VTSGDPTKRLAGLLRRLRGEHGAEATPAPLECEEGVDRLVHELVFSILLWEASSGQARAAFKRLRESVVDYNELRVCVPDEVASTLGEKYPLGGERALRLRTVLNEVFFRQHALSLSHLADSGKREARTFLESLDGVPCFASARLLLVAGLGHALPVDERLRDLLAAEGVVAEDASPEAAAGWLERHVRAEDALETHALFQAWSDQHGTPPKRERRIGAPESRATRPEPPAAANPRVVRASAAKGPTKVRKPGKAKPRSGK